MAKKLRGTQNHEIAEVSEDEMNNIFDPENNAHESSFDDKQVQI